jgi:hypothetical protein
MHHDDYLPQPRPPLSDDAAAAVLNFLHDLVAKFETAYAGQLLRHYRACAHRHGIVPPSPFRTDHQDDQPF